MINISMKRKSGGGFTITELLVATAVFSAVLLLIIVGFTQIGRLFYKGVTVSQTRQTATQIQQAVSNDIRLSATAVTPVSYQCPAGGCANGSTGTISAWCVGNHLYIPLTNNRVDLSAHDFSAKFGLIQAQLPGGACSGGVYASTDVAAMKPVEMLGDDMRINWFDIEPTPNSSGVFTVSITVAYGEDAAFVNGTLFNQPNPPQCRGISTGSQFCSVAQLNTTVSNRPTLQ